MSKWGMPGRTPVSASAARIKVSGDIVTVPGWASFSARGSRTAWTPHSWRSRET